MATTTTDKPAPRRPARRDREAPRLSADDLAAVLALLKGADSTELKLTVPPSAHRATIQGLPIDPIESQPRQVWFFDTPELTLSKAGLVVRARRIHGGRGDTVVKLRPVDPNALSSKLRSNPMFNVEVDVLPGGYVCSASMKGKTDAADVRRAVGGKVPLSSLFSKAQREFYAAHAPDRLGLDALLPLGPTFILKTRFDAEMGHQDRPTIRSLVAEMWLYPDGSRILELSTKCPPVEAFAAAIELRAYLSGRSLSLNGEQQTKTRTALEFYAGQLEAAATDG